MTNTTPKADITINRNMVKKYDGEKIFMQDDQEFEILLTNPTTTTYLAKIDLNGKSISKSGLVVMPGQKIFLERYLDDAKRFLFSTYRVDGDMKNAIAENGKVKVSFFAEQIPSTTLYWNYVDYTKPSLKWNNAGGFDQFYGSSAATYTCNSNILLETKSCNFDNIETGRVGKGSYSSQKFTEVDKDFYTWPFQTYNFHILPVSQKYNQLQDVRIYCTNCGKKGKYNWKFCPKCGTKI